MYSPHLRRRRPSYTSSRHLPSISVVDKLSTTQACAFLLRSSKNDYFCSLSTLLQYRRHKTTIWKIACPKRLAREYRQKKRMDVLITLLSSTENILCSNYIIKKKFSQAKFQIRFFSENQNKLHTIKNPIILTLIQYSFMLNWSYCLSSCS